MLFLLVSDYAFFHLHIFLAATLNIQKTFSFYLFFFCVDLEYKFSCNHSASCASCTATTPFPKLLLPAPILNSFPKSQFNNTTNRNTRAQFPNQSTVTNNSPKSSEKKEEDPNTARHNNTLNVRTSRLASTMKILINAITFPLPLSALKSIWTNGVVWNEERCVDLSFWWLH